MAMAQDFVRIPREEKTRLERVDIESRGLQEKIEALEKQIEYLKSVARANSQAAEYWRTKS
jgi:hypothetical protein